MITDTEKQVSCHNNGRVRHGTGEALGSPHALKPKAFITAFVLWLCSFGSFSAAASAARPDRILAKPRADAVTTRGAEVAAAHAAVGARVHAHFAAIGGLEV